MNRLAQSSRSRWLLAAIVVAALLLATGCQLLADTKLRNLERDLAPVLEQSNHSGRLDSAPLPTGDALFDRYAKAVEARLADSDPEYRELDAAVVPDDELAKWEAEFGADPRYWELRYCCASCANFKQSADGRFIAPTDFLHEARQRGIATANTLLLLYLERNYEYDLRFNKIASAPPDRYFGFGDQGPPDSLPLRPAVDAALIAQAIELHGQQEAEGLLLLDEAVAAGPGQAWPLYLRAMYRFELGEAEAGLADLLDGNAVPQVDYPAPFPVSRAGASLGEAAPAGSAAVCGAILTMASTLPQRDYTDIQGHLLNALLAGGLSGDQRQLNAWHSFACRSVGERYSGNMPYFSSLYMIRQAADYWEEEYGAVLTADQLSTLQRMRGAMEELRRPVTDRFSRRDQVALTKQLVAVLQDRGYYLAYYFAAENSARVNTELMQPIIRLLQPVCYPDLKLTDELRRIDPLPIAESRHDRRDSGRR